VPASKQSRSSGEEGALAEAPEANQGKEQGYFAEEWQVLLGVREGQGACRRAKQWGGEAVRNH